MQLKDPYQQGDQRFERRKVEEDTQNGADRESSSRGEGVRNEGS